MISEYSEYIELIRNNKGWVFSQTKAEPEYFKELSKGQIPKFLVIGCSDSRVPLTSLTGTEPGEIFVHRNIANQVIATDLNFLSVLEYALESLNIQHIIVLGHYKCGGIKTAVKGSDLEMVDNWVSPIHDLYHSHKKELLTLASEQDQLDKLSEFNVIQQLRNILKTPTLHKAMKTKKFPLLHGWIFDIYTGLIKEMKLPLAEWKDLDLLDDEYFNFLVKMNSHIV